jgi:hypothetical protein
MMIKKNEKTDIWEKAYNLAWERLFNCLKVEEKDEILISPEGATAGRLASEAWNEANKVI